MESSTSSDARAVRRVRCPRCHCVLEEPSAPVYQCGGCGTSLRAKNRTGSGSAGHVARASPSRSGLPPPQSDVASTSRSSTPIPTPPHVGSTSRSGTPPTPPSPHVGTGTASWHRATTTTTDATATGSRHGSGDLVPVSAAGSGGDVASTSTTPPRDATASTRRQGTDAARSPGSGDVASTSSTPHATACSGRRGADTASRGGSDLPARNRVSEQVAMVEKRQSVAGQEVEVHGGDYEGSSARDAGGGGGGGARLSGGNRDATPESQDDTEEEEGMKRQAESTDDDGRQELDEPKSSSSSAHQPAAAAEPAPAREDDDDAGGKAPTTSPSRHEIHFQEEERLGPLRKRILKTVDELRGDLSELFSKSPELNNGTRARRPPPPRLPIPIPIPKQQGHVSRAAAPAAGFPARETRHATAALAAVRKPRQAPPPPPPRGLPSRRYRQCRAYSSCHHGHGCCCRQHHHGNGKPECSSCRGYCRRPARAPEPSAPAPRKAAAGKEKEREPCIRRRRRLLPPRNHCRPVLKGAPFIVCSGCFKLVQVPADFAVSVSTRTVVRRLRCGSCSAVLSYSYRDPARKKASSSYQDSMDRSSELHMDDPFAPFIDAFGLSSYSTTEEDERRRLPVSRNTSFDTLDGATGVGRLHRLMGYGSASELLRHSPDLYESFSERTTTPDLRVRQQHDRKGKGVCIDDDDDHYDVDDSDEEGVGGGALKRSAGKGSAWPLAWMPGSKGTISAGAIRIK